MSMTSFDPGFLAQSPALAKAVFVAYRQAIGFIKAHPEEAQAMLVQEVRRAQGARARKLKDLKFRLVNHVLSDEIDPRIVQRQSDWYQAQGISSAKIDAAQLLYQPPPIAQR
ncbi:MAG: hypothetical protein PHU21_10640 [Elusimicrobia bacterium]|nr:hypothetical protein [Elusimicrobiota bacterium]